MVSSVLILFMLVSVCSGDGGDGPETVKELDLPKYIGKWYQVYQFICNVAISRHFSTIRRNI